MWGKRQRDDEDWDGDRRDQSADRRDQRPDDRRGNGYWAEADEWGGPGATGGGIPGGSTPGGSGRRQGFGDVDRQGFGEPGRPGFGDADRPGIGDSPWGEPRRSRGDYGDGSFGGSGFGEFGRDSDRDPGRDLGFGGARQADPRAADSWQGDQWQSDARQGDPRRSARDFPEAGFGQQPGYGGGRGGDFGGGDFGGGDYRGGDRREVDRRDLDRRDGGGPRGEAGGWASPEPEMPTPMFTPAPQVPSAAHAPALTSSSPGGSRPYGRLLIFTLHDDGVAEFDRLAEQAADGVRAHEPDTLVYVMHVVPKAPMQRIIYEIYRDHAAFEAHQRQPHIQQFEDGRRSCVLVTNIIDLRLKYAKVAPLQGAGQPNGSQPNGSQKAPGARHRGPQALEPEGTWVGEPAGSRSPDLDGDWVGERSFDSGDRRSQDRGSSQYTGQRYRNN